MSSEVATIIIVFGRGLEIDTTGIRLSGASISRVHSTVSYIERNLAVFSSKRARVVFSGGWAAAAEGLEPPPSKFREATLMLECARALGIDGKAFSCYAEAYTEAESDSTLENILRVKEEGYLSEERFTADNPLGVVSSESQLSRINYLLHKALGLPPEAILHITSPGTDKLSGGLPEGIILIFTRLAFLGARSHSSLRRRHHILVMGHNIFHLHRPARSGCELGSPAR
jgi:hypothetical protein